MKFGLFLCISYLHLLMKKWLLIYLILNILASTLPGGYFVSILKLGNLIAHYHQHQSEEHESGIFKFLAAHYSDRQHHEEDHAEHEDLPFHHDSQSFAPQSPFLLPQALTALPFAKHGIVSEKLFPPSQQWLSIQFLSDIWQPPKV